MKKKISIISTFYNEEECIVRFIRYINKSFKKFKKLDYDLILIDDSSTDSSNDLVKNEIMRNKKIKLFTLKKRYGHSPSLQTAFDLVNKKNYAVIIDCDLQDSPKLIAENFSKIKNNETLHFVRKKRHDPLFQKFYTNIAYRVLNFISQGKIIMNAGYFKIIPPHVVKKVKKNNEIHPYWNYLFTKYSTKNKIKYYVKKKRIYGSSKFTIFTLNPWISFFSGIYFFRERFVNIVLSLLIINLFTFLIFFYNFYNIALVILLSFSFIFLFLSLLISIIVKYYKKKNKRIYCKYR